MKLTVYTSQLQESPELWLRKAGYTYLPGRGDGESSFVRRLAGTFYPRFHIYYKQGKDKDGYPMLMFDLHLDQKKPGYKGFNRHNAEYDGEVVEREIDRLKSFLLPATFK